MFSNCLWLMFLRMSLAFISPLGKVVSLKYAHGARSDPFNDENALKKTKQPPPQIPWLLSMGSCQLFSYDVVVEVSAESIIIVTVIESSLCALH